MLPQAHPLKKLTVAVAVALCAAAALAQESAPAAQDGAPAAQYIPYSDMSGVSPETIKQAHELGNAVVRDILDAYNRRPKETEATANRARERYDQIADEGLAADRDKVLEFLGIDPAASTSVIVFLSFSMPMEMLRSYAIEAMWAGATVVFKGVPPGKELGPFITEDLRQLVYGKGAAANISIDPRLFDAYNVKSVPTIVFSTVRQDLQCQGVNPVAVPLPGGTSASYSTCPPLDENAYWKISGAVTTSFALQAFIDDGAVGAKPHLTALAKGWAGQNAPGKEQRAFAGKWEDAISPSELQAAREAARAISAPASTKP